MRFPLGLSRRTRTFLVGVLLTSGFVVRASASPKVEEDDDNQLREDVILCEEAVAHATSCCSFDVQGDACRYYEYYATDSCGCSGGSAGSDRKHLRPVVWAGEGRRIAGLSCAAMNEVGADGSTECKRVKLVLDADNGSESHYARSCL
ncbi:hypothetical protein BH11MYX4_BH11MYX4_13430 [soil metagenome]